MTANELRQRIGKEGYGYIQFNLALEIINEYHQTKMKEDINILKDIKSTIDWLLQNGEFKDLETAYNSATNSMNIIDEYLKPRL